MAYILSKAIRSYLAPLRKGLVRGLTGKNELKVEADGEIRIIPVSPDVFLFHAQDGEVFPASRLYLLGGEDIRWVENGGESGGLGVCSPGSPGPGERARRDRLWRC